MPNSKPHPFALVLKRELAVPREAVFRCWTEPHLLTQWFTPAPWQTVKAEIEPRPGGRFRTVMRSPEGDEFDNTGVFLDVVPNEKIIFTDAFVKAWVPSDKAYMTAMIVMEQIDPTHTRYTATVMHWSEEDQKSHEAMGFHDGWGKATDQLEALAKGL